MGTKKISKMTSSLKKKGGSAFLTKSSKIKSLKDLRNICAKLRTEGKTIGLITGCFDILHFGHVKIFSFAKSRCDYLIVGLDKDKSVRLSKGNDRPYFPYKTRAKVLAALEAIDSVFEIPYVWIFGSTEIVNQYSELATMIKPTIIFTDSFADSYWKRKQKIAKKLGIKLILQRKKKYTSSTIISRKLDL